MKRALMIAYEFPPINHSGSARPFYFAKFLGDYGYRPVVLTRQGTGDWPSDEAPLSDLPDDCEILRARTWDGDNFAGWLGRWAAPLYWPIYGALRAAGYGPVKARGGIASRIGWAFPGLREGLHWVWPAVARGCRQYRRSPYDLIWATGPPWTSLMAGYWLSRLTGRPLVCDLRDPWTYGVLWRPGRPSRAQWNKRWERRAIRHAARTVFTSPLTTRVMGQRYDADTASKMATITNGFGMAPAQPCRAVPEDKCCFSFVGKLQANLKDPTVLLEGLRRACRNPELAGDVCFQFVGSMGEFEDAAESAGVSKNVVYVGQVSQADSRGYMEGADVLVVVQTQTGPGVDVISGKSFEYLRTGNPILAVVPENSGDAWLAGETDAGIVTGTNDAGRVADAIEQLWRQWKQGRAKLSPNPQMLNRFSRRSLAGELAGLFDEVLSQ